MGFFRHVQFCNLHLGFKDNTFLYADRATLQIRFVKPFNNFVTRKILQLSYYTFSIGILSYIANQTAKNLSHHGYEVDKLNQFWVDSHAFILMAAIIYVIAQIFKRGVEIQSENELTV